MVMSYNIYIYMELLDVHKSNQGNTTNLNISFSIENEEKKRAAQVEPTTYCLLGRCSTTELLRQLNGRVESRQYKARATSLTNLINKQTLTQHQGVDRGNQTTNDVPTPN